MTIEEILANQHTVKLVYSAPWSGFDQDGTEFTASVDYIATAHDCIGIARRAIWKLHKDLVDDETALKEFIHVHYAYVQE